MKIYVLCICVLQFAFAYANEETQILELPADGTCIPNRAYKVECNTCLCTPEGKLGACTLAACTQTLPKEPKQPPVAEPSADCKLGETKKEECSRCTCIEISKDKNEWTCKKLEKCDLDEHTRTKRSVHECNSGDTKYNDCNPCTCVQNSAGDTVWACGRAFCIARNRRDVNVQSDLKDTPCAPNDFFQLPNCITCYCNSAKTGYLCSDNVCDAAPPTTEAADTKNTDNNLNMMEQFRGRSISDLGENQNETQVVDETILTESSSSQTVQE